MIVVLTKAPVPGRVKTRLIPALGAEGAARLHAAMIDATLDLVAASGLPCIVALDGDFTDRLQSRGLDVEPQAAGDLGLRLRHALRGPGRRVALGTDCVVFDPAWLHTAATAGGVAIGPSDDGGYWTIGLDAPCDALFHDIPWSSADVLRTTLQRAEGQQLTMLPACYDVDTPADLERLLGDPRCPEAVRAAVSR